MGPARQSAGPARAVLIVARSLQGVAGAFVTTNSLALLRETYGREAMFDAAGSGYVYYFVTQYNPVIGALERRLARKRADAPPVPTELEISGWEIAALRRHNVTFRQTPDALREG